MFKDNRMIKMTVRWDNSSDENDCDSSEVVGFDQVLLVGEPKSRRKIIRRVKGTHGQRMIDFIKNHQQLFPEIHPQML